MCLVGLVKRVIPFILTFAAGLLIASVFIPITGPNFSMGGRKRHHRAQDEQMRQEIQRLREENLDLKAKLNEARDRSIDWTENELLPSGELPLTMDAPPPPVAPHAPKARR